MSAVSRDDDNDRGELSNSRRNTFLSVCVILLFIISGLAGACGKARIENADKTLTAIIEELPPVPEEPVEEEIVGLEGSE